MTQYSNIGIPECIIRYLTGGFLLLGVLLLMFPPMMATVAAYVILTTIIAWEPLYALLSVARSHGLQYMKKLASRPGDGRGLASSA